MPVLLGGLSDLEDTAELLFQVPDEPVRRYLRRMGMPERVITRYLEMPELGDLGIISFGNDDDGEIPPMCLRERRLTEIRLWLSVGQRARLDNRL